MKANSIKFETSLLFVKDINISKDFYNKILGQEITMDFGKCVIFKGGFSIMEKDYIHEIIYSLLIKYKVSIFLRIIKI